MTGPCRINIDQQASQSVGGGAASPSERL